MKDLIKPVYFKNPSDFRKWLLENHEKENELLVGFYKVSSEKKGITWSESVDQAICFGWIDGVRKSIDEQRYCIRFTPRKPTGTWSGINIKKVEELTGKGWMHPARIEAFKKRKEHRSRIYSYEKEPENLQKDFEKKFKANKKAWQFFHNIPPSYVRTAIHWVMSAKMKETKVRRLEELIKDSEAGRRIKRLNY
jgi:uncharacterized protein YdeI (YjbR/CyaY-like superfamily)